ncbi:hypothetical protein K438DRAFT_1806281 [Mycena galopus ATCC 62051]|nr:hypothetical protein K438DRAFT_1806281 [Mycena galopus ATCC 62051]
MARRSRRPPSLSRSVKNSLDATLHPQIDASLKQLKSCARSLQPILSTFADELQILHRIYYKGKNQHRPALFWRRVAEMRRYGDRFEELSLLSLVDSLRYAFFAEESQQNSKLLKGSWTHYPNPSSISYVYERIAATITLVQKMHERLTHAYQSFSLAMQTGAFIQLILTLAGIASRMSSLATELIPVLEQVQEAIWSILLALNIKPETQTHDDPHSRQTPSEQSTRMVASVQMSGDVYEDTGVSILRQDPCPKLPNFASEPAVAHAIHTVIPLPAVDVGTDLAVTVLPLPLEVIAKRAERTTRPENDTKRKKKRRRDEIDDIFG